MKTPQRSVHCRLTVIKAGLCVSLGLLILSAGVLTLAWIGWRLYGAPPQLRPELWVSNPVMLLLHAYRAGVLLACSTTVAWMVGCIACAIGEALFKAFDRLR
jgi:hypothetical protein